MLRNYVAKEDKEHMYAMHDVGVFKVDDYNVSAYGMRVLYNILVSSKRSCFFLGQMYNKTIRLAFFSLEDRVCLHSLCRGKITEQL